MLFIAVSTTPLCSKPFSEVQLETVSAKLGNFHLLLAFDKGLTTFAEFDSHLVLTESMKKLDKKEIANLLTFNLRKIVKGLVLSIISLNLTTNEIDIYRSFQGRALYYSYSDDKTTLYISTHIRLLQKVGVEIKENKKAVAEYLLFGTVLSPATLFEKIKKVLRGQFLKVQCAGDSLYLETEHLLSQNRRPRLKEPPSEKTAEDTTRILRMALAGLRSLKGKTALSFSGGLDSSILAGLLKQEIGNIQTYSLNYPFPESSKSPERYYPVTAAKAMKLRHSFFEVSARDYVNTLVDLIWEGEAPAWFYLQQPLFGSLLARAPADEEVVIFGEGADSLFGNRYHNALYYKDEARHSGNLNVRMRALIFRLFKNPLLERLFKVILKLLGKTGDVLALARAKTSIEFNESDHFLWQAFLLGDQEFVAQKFGFSLKEIVEELAERLEPFLGNSLYDLVTIHSLLTFESLSMLNKLAEKHGRKVYFPFLNDLLVDYAFQLPWKFKLREKKYVLRQVARKMGIPSFIIDRPKSAFRTKAEYWALPGKLLEPFVTICSGVFTEREFRLMQSTNPRKCATLWLMVNYALWKLMYIDQADPSELKKKLNELVEKK